MALIKKELFSYICKFPQIGARVTNMLLLILFLLQAPLHFAQDQSTPDSTKTINMVDFSRGLAKFSFRVYNQLIKRKPNQNIIFSPLSIRTGGAMIRMGAKGITRGNLDNGLVLVYKKEAEIPESFHNVLEAYKTSSILRFANRIYIKAGYELKDEFSSIMSKQFLSDVKSIDFDKNVEAANQINYWVSLRTNNQIKDIVPPSTLNGDTQLVLINAMSFKGNWVHQFSENHTRNEAFYLSDSSGIRVPTMNMLKRLKYAELSALDATALELPYKDSDLSLLIVLPNSNTGLPQLEKKLSNTTFSQVTEALYSTDVIVKLPKFKAEFDIELTETFKKLYMNEIFSDKADLSRIIKGSEKLKVSKIIHKAVIEVNERGTEAAEASGIEKVTHKTTRIFNADHPFNYYIVKDHNLIIFAGKLVNPTK